MERGKILKRSSSPEYRGRIAPRFSRNNKKTYFRSSSGKSRIGVKGRESREIRKKKRRGGAEKYKLGGKRP